MKQPKESVTVSLRLSAETLALLDAHAKAEGRTRANLMELIITTEMALRDAPAESRNAMIRTWGATGEQIARSLRNTKRDTE